MHTFNAVFALFLSFVVATLAFVVTDTDNSLAQVATPVQAEILEPETKSVIETVEATSTSLLFVGDVMLGRHVEDLSEEYGFTYPYKKLRHFLQNPDLTIGNFEGIAPEKHIPTNHFEMRFSVSDKAFHNAVLAGFDIFSLANNHADDYGLSGYQNTRNLCILYNIACYGNPTKVSSESSLVIHQNGIDIGFLFLDGTDALDIEEVVLEIIKLKQKTEIQIVYIHWGNEYLLFNSSSQKSLAHLMIDSGVDAVIGHHPHVVQNIELYKGKPIFYSLGNFIFDQYFSNDVQEGLMIGLEITNEQYLFSAFGITTLDSHAQPDFMSKASSTKLFGRIFKDIKNEDGVDSINGTIAIKR